MLIHNSAQVLSSTAMNRKVSRLIPSTWEQFEWLHGAKLRENSLYEHQFFEMVLRHVPSLRPEQVFPQFHIQDSRGLNRYIDFVVTIGSLPKLALEVDGYDKTGSGGFMSPDQWDDFTYRQNEIVLQGMTLLRFSNREFSRRPQDAIRQIEDALDKRTTALAGNLLAKGAVGLVSYVGKHAGMFADGFRIGWQARQEESMNERERVREALKAKYGIK